MFYTIYKVTNNVNGKHYIGKHQTKDINDGYMGSGKLIKAAIKKYGADNFHKEILHVVQTEKEMDILEKILVVPDPEISYNLCEGGRGGFSYINSIGKNIRLKQTEKQKIISRRWIKENRHKFKLCVGEKRSILSSKNFKGKTHTDEWKKNHSELMKNKQKGNLNSQYGTCWITNGQVNKKIKKDELDNWLELGYYRGRI